MYIPCNAIINWKLLAHWKALDWNQITTPVDNLCIEGKTCQLDKHLLHEVHHSYFSHSDSRKISLLSMYHHMLSMIYYIHELSDTAVMTNTGFCCCQAVTYLLATKSIYKQIAGHRFYLMHLIKTKLYAIPYMQYHICMHTPICAPNAG